VIEAVRVSSPFIVDRGRDRVVIEFLGCVPIELDRNDAVELCRELRYVLFEKRRPVPYEGTVL
jgi:hypothetical protein